MTTIPTRQALQRIAEAREEHNECPDCGDDFEGVDMARDGDLVFIHDGQEMCSVETEVDRVE